MNQCSLGQFLALFFLVCGQLAFGESAEGLHQDDIFVAGREGYHTYRIPALIAASNGTLLAFCEGRKKGGGDSGDIDLLLKQSTDLGKHWSEQRVLWNDGENTCGNPCPVVDQQTGTILLLLTHNLGLDNEKDIKLRK